MTRRLLPLGRPTGAWPMHPAHLDAYIETLGQPLAVEFFREFGGLTLYLTTAPRGRSGVEALLGTERVVALAERLSTGQLRVPLPRAWLVHVLRHTYGLTIQDIVRELRVTDVAVWRLLRTAPTNRIGPPPTKDPETGTAPDGQLSLF